MVANGLVQRLHVNTCGGRGAAVVRVLPPCPRPVVGREATVEVNEGRPPAVVVATDRAVPPRTEAMGRRPPPVEGMRAFDAIDCRGGWTDEVNQSASQSRPRLRFWIPKY